MSKFAIVVMMPENRPHIMDFVSREFDTMDEVADLLKEVDEKEPKWRLISFCHTEDLPLLMEPPDA